MVHDDAAEQDAGGPRYGASHAAFRAAARSSSAWFYGGPAAAAFQPDADRHAGPSAEAVAGQTTPEAVSVGV